MSRYRLFDRSRLELRPLAERGHDLHWANCRALEPPTVPFSHREFGELIEQIVAARRRRAPVILMMGGHPIKLGLSRFLVDLIARGWLTHVAVNGSAVIHDFELALVGGTSEDVARWIPVGQFGLWQETARLNDVIAQAVRGNEGLGETVGRVIEQESFPYRDVSLAAVAWRAGIPLTCHVSVGSDIIHALPNCDGAALGRATYTDFLIFAETVSHLEGGVYLNVGTLVTGPEVYLKALSMARNVARQERREIRRFTTAVFDLVPLPDTFRTGPPGKDHFQYYYRPWKTILVRTVADGGNSYYFCGDHRETIPTLWARLATAAYEPNGS